MSRQGHMFQKESSCVELSWKNQKKSTVATEKASDSRACWKQQVARIVGDIMSSKLKKKPLKVFCLVLLIVEVKQKVICTMNNLINMVYISLAHLIKYFIKVILN